MAKIGEMVQIQPEWDRLLVFRNKPFIDFR
jgi:hypothetical protein